MSKQEIKERIAELKQVRNDAELEGAIWEYSRCEKEIWKLRCKLSQRRSK